MDMADRETDQIEVRGKNAKNSCRHKSDEKGKGNRENQIKI